MFTSVTIDGAPIDGYRETHEYLADGRILSGMWAEASDTGGITWEGSWRTQGDDRLCIEWSIRLSVPQGCFRAVERGEQLVLIDDQGAGRWWYDLPDGSVARPRPPRPEAPKISESR